MSWIRDKSPERIRASALEMARKTIAEGCGTCATAYLDPARRNGATEDEIAAAPATNSEAGKSPQPSQSSPLQ
ncbi:MAG: carboxymuconolactone decarboxylase family protein [Egibacteraceae bacterium]